EAGADEGRAEQLMLQSWYGRADPSVGELVKYDDQVRKEIERLGVTLATLVLGGGGQGRGAVEAPTDKTPVVENRDSPAANQTPSAPSWDVFRSRQRSSVLVFQNDHMEQSE